MTGVVFYLGAKIDGATIVWPRLERECVCGAQQGFARPAGRKF